MAARTARHTRHPLRDETRAPLARPIGEAPKVIHKLTGGQTDTLKAALRDLTDARKLLDPTTR